MLEEKNMGEVNLNGLTGLNLKETLTIIIQKEKDNILGQMVESMQGNGKLIKWKEKVLSPGQMEGFMLGIILMIKNMVMECLSGQTEDNMMVNGELENNMEKVNIQEQAYNKEKEFGKMVEE